MWLCIVRKIACCSWKCYVVVVVHEVVGVIVVVADANTPLPPSIAPTIISLSSHCSHPLAPTPEQF